MDTKQLPWLTELSLLTIIPGITHILLPLVLPCLLQRRQLGKFSTPWMLNMFLSSLEVNFFLFVEIILVKSPCSDLLLYLSLGLVGYPSDDINKFLWMVRIGGGVFPHIREPDYLVSYT